MRRLGLFGILIVAFAAPSAGLALIKKTKPQKPEVQLLKDAEKTFQIQFTDTSWHRTPPPSDMTEVVFLFRGPIQNKSFQPTLTVRKDLAPKSIRTIERYVDKWLKSYPKFGYTVIGSKPFEHNFETAYVIDFIKKDSNKQFRQVVFFEDRKSVLFTCSDTRENFSNTLKACNKLVRSFERL